MKRIVLFLSLLLVVCTSMAHDHELPPGFVMEENYIEGLSEPTDLKLAPDGRIFIAEKGGTIRIVEDGILLPQPFYSVQTQSPNERGLGGIALDPNFESNGFVYLFYTHSVENKNIVARVTSFGNTVIPGSEIELIRFDRMHAAFHNGGAMVFDDMGKLIIGTGDGTGHVWAPDMEKTLGKIIRINSDGSIPSDNPFYAVNQGVYKAISAYGIRNPYTMAKSKSTGRIFFNDVGNDNYEEINEYIPGKNYGWYQIEGPLGSTAPPDSNYKDPVFAYDHEFGCAIVGASFYEPETVAFPPGYFGMYFFMDLCEGKILYLDPDTYHVTEFASGLKEAYNNLEIGPDGHLYLINILDGNLAKISYVGLNSPPLISIQPASQVMAVGEDVSFSVDATGENLDFRWFRNGILVQPVGGPSITLQDVQLSDDQAEIFVVVSNQYGAITSNTVNLTVVEGSRPSIQFRDIAPKYAAGDTLFFSALVTDPDQTVVLPQALTWKIDFHHDEHAHPALASVSGINSGTYVVETYGEVDTNVFFRIHLSALDSSGLTSDKFVDILPQKVTMTFSSQPEGAEVNIDGIKETTDFLMRSVKGLYRTVEVPAYAVIGDSLYQFLRWFDHQDTLIRTFEAQDDTFSFTLKGIHEYLPSIPAIGNLAIFEDTTSGKNLYSSMEVSRIQENWDVLGPFPFDKPPFPEEYWSAEWTGPIHPPASGYYTFYLFHDGKVTLTVGDSILIEEVVSAGDLQEDTARVWLNAGENLDLRLEYDHHTYLSRVELDWQFSIVKRHPVPFAKNYPVDNLVKDEDGIVLFPNPTSDPVVYIYLNPQTYAQSELGIKVFDSNGRLCKSFVADLDNGIYPLSVSDLNDGLYYLTIIYGMEEKSLKFIKY